MAWLADLVSRIVTALLTFWAGERARGETRAADRAAGAADAAQETQEVVGDVADARAGLPDPSDDPDALADELRAERRSAPGSSGRRRPF